MPKYRFPDPTLRSVRKPTTDCSREKIVGLYNQAHKTERTYLTEEIKDWFCTRATGMGWSEVEIGQNAATLRADVSINVTDSTGGRSDNIVPITRVRRSKTQSSV